MTDFPYKSAKELQDIADGSSGLPDDSGGMSLPMPSKRNEKLNIVVFFYGTSIAAGEWRIFPAHHVMHLDAQSGEVLDFRSIKPQDLGISHAPGQALYSAKFNPSPDPQAEKHYSKLDRFFKISPNVWNAYMEGKVRQETKPLVQEYVALFGEVAKAPLIPYYKALSPDFFRWLEDASR